MAGAEHGSTGEKATHASNEHHSGRGKGLAKRLAYIGFGTALLLPILGSIIGSVALAGWGFLGGLLVGSAGLVGRGLSNK